MTPYFNDLISEKFSSGWEMPRKISRECSLLANRKFSWQARSLGAALHQLLTEPPLSFVLCLHICLGTGGLGRAEELKNVGFGGNIGDTILTDPGFLVQDCHWSNFPIYLESSLVFKLMMMMMMKEAAVRRKAGKQEGTVSK